MCGIVGYIGNRDSQEILINGLKKLEYRGYDSAGIAVMDQDVIKVSKSVGRLANLEGKLGGCGLSGQAGIGHTRWATHGRPSDENSHPHQDDSRKFAVVHNGIIENYQSIKEDLITRGHLFLSETDTEVIVHLLSDLYDGDIVSTTQKAVSMMRGAYALGIMTEHEPDKLVAVRLSSPLVIGVGDGENFIGSDIPALLEYTREVYFLENGEMAVLTRDGVELMTIEGNPVQRDIYHVEWDAVQAEKDGYDTFMLKEIHEQPKAFRDTMGSRITPDGRRIELNEISLNKDKLQNVDRIHIVACGTAYHAGLIGKNVIEKLVRIPVEVDVASEYRYRDPIITPRTMVIVVSQSGETADTLAALREAQERGASVIAITNVVGSSVAREADEVIFTWAGPEIAVASTKAYTSQLIAFYLLGFYMAQELGTVSENQLADMIGHLQALPRQAEQVLAQSDTIKACAEKIAKHEDLFFIGRGLDFAVAQEGSLKLKEISYIHSEAYAAGELKHGTLALIEEGVPVIAIATQEKLFEKMVSNITEVKARGAYVLGLASEGDQELQKTVDEVVFIPRTIPLLTPAISVIPLQLLSIYATIARGYDVDKPRNLAKSVTVE
jgi:glucosamine--fructose-6-phosphate aminotransferase (isomerizing)